MKKCKIIKLILAIILLCALVICGYLLLKHFGILDMTQEEVQSIVEKGGALAPLLYVFITFIQVSVIPIPGAVTILAGNYIFGAFQAFIYSYIGMMIGSVVSFALGKYLGRPFVNWVAGSAETVDAWIAKLRGRENVLLFFMFLLPLFPDDILCAVAGILPVGWLGFILMQIITRATSIGGTLLFMSGEIIPYEGWGLAVIGVIAVIAIAAFAISMVYAKQIDEFMSRIFEKINPNFKPKEENANDIDIAEDRIKQDSNT